MPRLATGLLLAALTAGIAACSPAAPSTESPEPSPTVATTVTATAAATTQEASPTPTPTEAVGPSASASATPTAPSKTADQLAAEAAALEFFAIYRRTVEDPESSLKDLAEITDGDMRQMMTELVLAVRSRGYYSEGEMLTHILDLKPLADVDGEKRIEVLACTDITNSRVMDIATKQPADDEGEKIPFQLWRLLLAERDGWKVINGTNKDREIDSCP